MNFKYTKKIIIYKIFKIQYTFKIDYSDLLQGLYCVNKYLNIVLVVLEFDIETFKFPGAFEILK